MDTTYVQKMYGLCLLIAFTASAPCGSWPLGSPAQQKHGQYHFDHRVSNGNDARSTDRLQRPNPRLNRLSASLSPYLADFSETGTYALHGVAGQLDLTENEDAETTSDSQHTDRSTDISEMKENDTAQLLSASRNGDVEVIRNFIDHGNFSFKKSVAVKPKGERSIGTPLHQATLYGNFEVIKLLINSDKSLVNARDDNGLTPIFWACSSTLGNWENNDPSYRLEVVKYFVFAKAEVNIVNSSKSSPLYYAALGAAQNNIDPSIGRFLLKESYPEFIYNAAKRIPEGMFLILHGLEMERCGREVLFETSILYPNEVAYTLTHENFHELDLKWNDQENSYIKEDISNNFGAHATKSILHFGMKFRYWREMFTYFIFSKEKGSDNNAPVKPNGYAKMAWYPVCCDFVPVLNPTSKKFLHACVYISDYLDKPELFNNEVIQAITEASWVSDGYWCHLLHSIAFFALVSLIAITNYMYHEWSVSDNQNDIATAAGMLWTMFALNTILYIGEITQFFYAICMSYSEKTTRYGLENASSNCRGCDFAWLSIVLDVHNLLDWVLYSLIYAGIAIRCTNGTETHKSAAVMSIVTVLVVIKSLHFMRAFKRIGLFVRILYLCIDSVKQLLFVLFFVIFGFSQALYLLEYSNIQNDDGKPDYLARRLTSIAYTLVYLYQPDLKETHNTTNPVLATVIMCLFILIATVLILNLLIAILNARFEDLQTMQSADLYKEQARMTLENRYLHALLKRFGSGLNHNRTASTDNRSAAAQPMRLSESSSNLNLCGNQVEEREVQPPMYMYVLMRRVDKDKKLQIKRHDKIAKKKRFEFIEDKLKVIEQSIENYQNEVKAKFDLSLEFRKST